MKIDRNDYIDALALIPGQYHVEAHDAFIHFALV